MGTYMVKIIRVVLQQSFVLFQNRGTRLKFYCLLIVFFHVYYGFEMYFRRSIITDMMVQVENGAICVIMVHVITCCFFVCLGFSSHSRISHSYGDVTITSEGLQILSSHWAVRVSHGSHGIIRIPFRVYHAHFMKTW